MTRRHFLTHTGAGLVVTALGDVQPLLAQEAQRRSKPAGSRASDRPIRLRIVAPPDTTSLATRNGLQLGRDEAERAASLLGAPIEVLEAGGAADAVIAPDPATDVDRVVIAFGVHEDRPISPTSWSVRADVKARLAMAVRILADRAGVSGWSLLAEETVRADIREAVRQAVSAAARNTTFEGEIVEGGAPSASTVAVIGSLAFAARSRGVLLAPGDDHTWLVRIPLDAPFHPGTLASREACVVEWHDSLARFGGSELNERYARKFGESTARMDSDAWAGWFAVRMVVDAVLRARNGGDLETAIATGRFDGHKGVALTFDKTSRRLRQPLYVVARPEATTEPVVWEEP